MKDTTIRVCVVGYALIILVVTVFAVAPKIVIAMKEKAEVYRYVK